MNFKRNVDLLEKNYRDVYLSEFAKVLQTLPAEKLEYCAEIATKNFSLENGNFNISESKNMTLIAKTIAQNKNPEALIGMNFADAARVNQSTLPDLNLPAARQQDNSFTQGIDLSFKPRKSREEICDNIYKLINENNPGPSNSMFCQSRNINMNEMPTQGWKFHISANSLEDYERLCEVAIPELTKLGVGFKVVRPDKFEYQMNSQQIGKAITIYPTENFDINNFSPKLRTALLDTQSVQPIGDKNIAGRIYARYGRFMPSNTSEHYITDSRGNISLDPKAYRKSEPDFLLKSSPEDVLGFYSKSKEKYLRTGDYKTYLQEKKTMLECDGKSHCYFAVKVDPADLVKAKNILTNTIELANKYTQSFLTRINDKDCLMVHKSELNDMLNALDKNSMKFERFDWDFTQNFYIVPDKAFDTLSEKFNSLYGVQTYKTTGDVGILQCDTVFNEDILKACRENNIPVKEWDVNFVENIRESLNTMYEQGFSCSSINNQNLTSEIR